MLPKGHGSGKRMRGLQHDSLQQLVCWDSMVEEIYITSAIQLGASACRHRRLHVNAYFAALGCSKSRHPIAGMTAAFVGGACLEQLAYGDHDGTLQASLLC